MGAPRRKGGLVARRRPGDEGDEDGSIIVHDDSLSEPSVPSDVDDDADGEGSESSEIDTPNRKANGKPSMATATQAAPVATNDSNQFDTKIADTQLMLNGLAIADGSERIEEIHFDQLPGDQVSMGAPDPGLSTVPVKTESPVEQRRREHEEYKKRRDADPAFVPNRGGFYMHDERFAGRGHAPTGSKSAIRGRGRGRGGSSNNFDHPPQTDNAPWAHDLHHTLSEANTKVEASQTAADTAPDHQLRPAVQPMSNPPLNRNFSSSIQTGVFQLRVFLPAMQDPIVFSSVPCMQHTRLPHVRPPLRRDKPVRISLPDKAPMYIFPAVDRSFIFIPRALRPNQQGFGRSRGRGSIGGLSGFRSGRNSVYGGSAYSPSVAMSRRSSFARDRDGMVSPAMSVMSRATGMTGPVVRLPAGGGGNHGGPPTHFGNQLSYKPAPPMAIPQASQYSNIPMHQPRPQKAVAVAELDQFHHAQPMQQPFAHQVPVQFGDVNMTRRTSYPSQHGTPLSNIPERAIHAQPFQPYPQAPYQQQLSQAMAPGPMPQQVPQQHMYYGQQPYGPGNYYYPQGPVQQQGPPLGPGPYNPYFQAAPAPAPAPVPAPMHAPPGPRPEVASQAGTVAHETNGMVYYYDQTQLVANQGGQQAGMAYQQGPYGGGMQTGYGMPQQGPVYYPPPPA